MLSSPATLGDAWQYVITFAIIFVFGFFVTAKPLPIPSNLPGPRRYPCNDILPDGTRIPAGAGFDICFSTMLRKEELWGEDALLFKPERFLDEKEPSPYKYPVFHAGPRMCLGKPLALMNMKLAMSIILTSEFKITDRAGHSGEYLWTLVEAMKDGFEVNITPKQQQ